VQLEVRDNAHRGAVSIRLWNEDGADSPFSHAAMIKGSICSGYPGHRVIAVETTILERETRRTKQDLFVLHVRELLRAVPLNCVAVFPLIG
jgi:hypothetical protein